MKLNRLVLVALVAAAITSIALSAHTVSAKDLTITLGPGETARVPMRFWCLDFGKPFPTAVSGPNGPAPAPVLNVLQAALNKGTLTTDPYQTQLAIWKAADGTFHDVGTEGHVLAQQIISDSATATRTPLPAGVATLDQVVAQGTLKTTVENFTVVTDTTRNNSQPFMGTGELVIQNTSAQRVTFVLVEGAVFKPAAGASGQTTTGVNEQTLLSHQDTTKPPTLPQTGGTPAGNSASNMVVVVGLLLAAALLLAGSRGIRLLAR